MKDFFQNLKVEFRITIGDEWDAYIAKSDKLSLLNYLCYVS